MNVNVRAPRAISSSRYELRREGSESNERRNWKTRIRAMQRVRKQNKKRTLVRSTSIYSLEKIYSRTHWACNTWPFPPRRWCTRGTFFPCLSMSHSMVALASELKARLVVYLQFWIWAPSLWKHIDCLLSLRFWVAVDLEF